MSWKKQLRLCNWKHQHRQVDGRTDAVQPGWLHNPREECKMCKKVRRAYCAETFPRQKRTMCYSQRIKSTSCTRATPQFPMYLHPPYPSLTLPLLLRLFVQRPANMIRRMPPGPTASGAVITRITWNSRKQDPTQQTAREKERERGRGREVDWEKVSCSSEC